MKAARIVSGLFVSAIALGTAPVHAQDQGILINPSFEELNDEGMPSGWFSNANTGSGYEAAIDTGAQTDGLQSVRLFSTGSPEAPFANLAQLIDAAPYRGHRLRLTASVKAGEAVSQHLGLWFRVDKADGSTGFFENMQRYPITGRDWQTYTIEGFIDPTATRITVGILMVGEGEAWLDNAQVIDMGEYAFEAASERSSEPRLEKADGDIAAAPLSERGAQNLAAFARLYGLVRWFHPSDTAMNADWDALAISALPGVESASGPDDLARALRETFAPLAPSLQIVAGSVNDLAQPVAVEGPVLEWQHNGLGGSSQVYTSRRLPVEDMDRAKTLTEELPGGVSFRLPLFAVASQGDGSDGVGAAYLGKPEGWTPSGHDRTTRIAATIAAWSTLDHFYPYWDVVETDWQSVLERSLSDAATAADDTAFHAVLERLVAAINDGHGQINYPTDVDAVLPIDWMTLDGQLVVTAVADDISGVEPGMVVTAIDGVPAGQAIAERGQRISGSDHYRQHWAERAARFGASGDEVAVTVAQGTAPAADVTLTMQGSVRSGQFAKLRPDAVSQVEPGIFYIDLSRINQAAMDDALVQLADARGIVFDLRGYPRSNPQWLGRLTDQTIRSAKFMRPQFTGPDGAARYEEDGGWTIAPAQPRLTDNVVFLTNASAISFAESILGTVKANGLGTVIGSPTAGANGNVSSVSLPGGYTMRYTGMRVTNRDGSQHHLIGVEPDIAIQPTRAGVAGGADEVLDEGIRFVRDNAG